MKHTVLIIALLALLIPEGLPAWEQTVALDKPVVIAAATSTGIKLSWPAIIFE